MDGRTSISSLRFEGYTVNEVLFKKNDTPDDVKEWKLTFNINNITRVDKENNRMAITLSTDIFKDIDNAPFSMRVEILGMFSLNGDDDIRKYEANAIAIMYPYLRAIISTYTASANISPVILPAINVNAMLKRNKEETKQEN